MTERAPRGNGPGTERERHGPGQRERWSAREAIAAVADAGTFAELPAMKETSPSRGASPPNGPLGWEGYDAMRVRAGERTGEDESVVCGTARVGATEAVLISFEFGYLGGSLGERTGDRLEAAHIRARERGCRSSR